MKEIGSATLDYRHTNSAVPRTIISTIMTVMHKMSKDSNKS